MTTGDELKRKTGMRQGIPKVSKQDLKRAAEDNRYQELQEKNSVKKSASINTEAIVTNTAPQATSTRKKKNSWSNAGTKFSG